MKQLQLPGSWAVMPTWAVLSLHSLSHSRSQLLSEQVVFSLLPSHFLVRNGGLAGGGGSSVGEPAP